MEEAQKTQTIKESEEMMASRELKHLQPDMAEAIKWVRDYCKSQGFNLLIYCTRRNFHEQAILYRQSRKWSTIRKKLSYYRSIDLPELADILVSVGPQNGPHITNAGPGESWHQFGLAVDAVPLANGKCLWNDDAPEWQTYGRECVGQGLTWAGNWKGFKEFPHCQFYRDGNPIKKFGTMWVKGNLRV